MWLSKNMRNKGVKSAASTASVSRGADRRITAAGDSGTGQYACVAPAGIYSVPYKDEEAVILETGSGKLCLGMRTPYHDFNLEPGEVALFSQSGAMILLSNDGRIHVKGEVVYE